jgi:two-component system sensor kinase FixL
MSVFAPSRNVFQRALKALDVRPVALQLSLALRLASTAAERIAWFGKRIRPDGGSRGTTAPMRNTLDLVPVAIVGIDERNEIAFANGKARELFDYRDIDLHAASAMQLFPEWSDHALSAETEPNAQASGTRTLQTLARRRDGVEFLAEVTTSQCRIDGAPMRLAAVVDRSERDELHHHRREIAHLARVSALGELAGSLAHELNQPLTAILSNAQAAQRFMEARPINLPEIHETLKDIVADDCRAGEILRKIRTLVKKGDVELQPLDIGGVVREVALLVRSDAVVRRIRTTLDIADNLPLVQGDKVQLQQVVLNLLLNAFDAVHGGHPDDRVVAVRVSAEPDAMVRITVRDRGHGLTVDQLDEVFKPFYTSKPHGMGLGLSISRTIVAMHGGRLWAENNPDRGASFYVMLSSAGNAGPNRSCPKP